MNQLNLLKVNKYIITGGPTREWIDPVRYISNSSSGKMGIALADIAYKKNSNVVFIHGPINNNLLNNKKYNILEVETTQDMLKAVISEISDNSLLIMAAAPADYSPTIKYDEKIKKLIIQGELIIKFKKNPDILREVAKIRKNYQNTIVVGFAAETKNIKEYGLQKLKEKDLDFICINNVSKKEIGFNSNENEIIMINKKFQEFNIPKMSKTEIAGEIFKIIEIT